MDKVVLLFFILLAPLFLELWGFDYIFQRVCRRPRNGVTLAAGGARGIVLPTTIQIGNVENPPFFPRTLEELAEDAAFSCRVGLSSSISRMRVDVRLKLIDRERHALAWLARTH